MPTRDFAWTGEWLSRDDPSLAMSHTGIVITRDGSVVLGAAPIPSLTVRRPTGEVIDRVPVDDATELHDLTLVVEDGEELIWVADTGIKLFGGGADLELRRGERGGQVLQISLDGRTRRVLPRPPIDLYSENEYIPTAVAVAEKRHGGNGDIWIADGYGASLVHRFATTGTYLQTIDGEQGAGRFNQPHDVLIDYRGSEPALLVSDRINQRIQVYDLEGVFRRVIGADCLPGPTQMTVSDDVLAVTDLLAGRVTLFDAEDRLIGHLFPHPSPPSSWNDVPDAWPNIRAADGTIAAAPLESGSFHNPHGIAAANGVLYVSEFSIGERVVLLTAAGT